MSDTTNYPAWVQTPSEKRLHDDFRVFLFHIWRHLKLPAPTPIQYDIALWVSTGPRRRMVQAFRGAAKTYITCAYVCWRLYRNPQERVKIVSANEEKALENGTFIRRLIEEVEELAFLRPRAGGRDSNLKFDVGPADAAPTPSVSCVGITGQLTGGRATILIPDDIEVPKNSLTELQRERLAELVKEFDALVVPEGFDIVWLGTPQTEQSIYNTVRKRGYECRVWPVRYPKADKVDSYAGALAPAIAAALRKDPALAGRSTEPGRFTDIDLVEREASYGASSFALQFMLDTSLSDALRYPLRTRDLVCIDVPRKEGPATIAWTSDPRNAWTDIDNLGFTGDRLYRPMHVSETMLPYQGKILVVDPSGRGKDSTGWVVLYHLNGLLFLADFGHFAGGYDDETLTGIAETAKTHQVNKVLVEGNFGDGMFLKLLAPHIAKAHPCEVVEVKAAGQKERRIIDCLEPVLNQHRLVIDADACRRDVSRGVNSLLYQLTHLTKDRNALKHDDVLDALAHGVAHFGELLAQDSAKAEEEHLEKLREAMRRDFIATYYGRGHLRPSGNNFASTNRGHR